MPPRSASCEVAHGPRQFSLSVVAQPSELLTDSKPPHRNRCAPFDLRPKGIAIVAACENDQRRGGVDLPGPCFNPARAQKAARACPPPPSPFSNHRPFGFRGHRALSASDRHTCAALSFHK